MRYHAAISGRVRGPTDPVSSPTLIIGRLIAVFLLMLHAVAAADSVRIDLRGVDGALRDNVLAHLGDVRIDPRRRMSERGADRILATSRQRIRDALKPYGYYAPEIDAELRPAGDDFVLALRVERGPPVRVAESEVSLRGSGASDPELVAWRRAMPLRGGMRLDQPAWTDYKDTGLDTARRAGYLAAAYAVQRIAIDLDNASADLALELDTGPRYVMGRTVFEDNPLRPGVLESISRFEPGDFYSARLVNRLRIDLSGTGYFDSVTVTESRNDDAEPPSVDLRIVTETGARNRMQGALGVGTDTGIRLQANYTRVPMSSRGDRLDVGVGWREIDDELALRGTYRVPQSNRPRNYWVADGTLKFENRDLEVKRRDEDEDFIPIANGNIDDRHLRLGQLRVRNHSAGDQQRLTTLFAQILNSTNDYEPFSAVDGVGLLSGDIDSLLRGNDTAASVGIEVNIVDVQGRGFGNRGKRDTFWLFRSLYSRNENSGFTQAYASSRRVYNVGDRGKWLIRGEIGYTESEVDRVSIDVGTSALDLSVTRLPSFYRFRAGGGTSVRGYGPEQLSNNNVGSNHLLTASVEYEHRFLPNWSLAGFVDVGNAFNDWSEPELKTGVGLGLRWYSVVGPVRVDIAQARDFTGRPWRVHLSVGTPLL